MAMYCTYYSAQRIAMAHRLSRMFGIAGDEQDFQFGPVLPRDFGDCRPFNAGQADIGDQQVERGVGGQHRQRGLPVAASMQA